MDFNTLSITSLFIYVYNDVFFYIILKILVLFLLINFIKSYHVIKFLK